MKSYGEIILELRGEYDRLKALNRKTIYVMSAEISSETADRVKSYFEKLGSSVEIKMCPRKRWDIIITF